ncbi:MAG: hypothetical protein HYV59_09810 [Planctomycetes bacterium]|nr:hypothetical protein [Planctomycetota bacterium]
MFMMFLMVCTLGVTYGVNAHAGAIRSGFNSNSLPSNDDSSTSLVSIGFFVNFFGSNYTDLYINNNGNVTFDSAQSTYTPYGLVSTSRVIIAPFFADVDTRGSGSGVVTYSYGAGSVDGRNAFGVNWIDVGYYSAHVDKLNSFQLILIDRSDIAPGDFDFEFNYDKVQWETGDASSGSGGLGGNSARVGYSNGTGDPGTYYERSGSGVPGSFLDSNSSTGLIYNSLNSSVSGRYLFQVRNGEVTVVDLVSFTAEGDSNGNVALNWETAAEVNNAGFNIYRSKHKDSAYTKINDELIDNKGSETEGARYSFEDAPGRGSFYYKLEDVDTNGTKTMHGPVKVRVRNGGSEARKSRV